MSWIRGLGVVAAGVALGACAGGGAEVEPTGPAVSFAQPENGSTVASPFEVCLAVSEFTIEPSGEVNEGAGHHHVLVDPWDSEVAAIVAGEPIVIPEDETHIHMGDGSDCTMIEAEAGVRTLRAVVADGAHTNLNPPLTAEITVVVE